LVFLACVSHLINPFPHKFVSDHKRTKNRHQAQQQHFIMTILKPTTTRPASPAPKKTVKFAKTAGSAKYGSAAAAEKKSIDAPLQGMNTNRRYARRGSKTAGMLSASASRLIFDTERCFGRDKLDSASELTLMSALHLSIRKGSHKCLTRGPPSA
jgi:hypothetical protein